jgi:sugar/nucleoside kinase (ribokinase family)
MDIVGLGLATVDIITLIPRLPQHDEVFRAQSILLEGGGPVATALVAAAKLGVATTYLGPIASTRWGALTRSGLESCGVDTRHAPDRDDGEQPVSVILVDQPTGQRSILFDSGNMRELAPAEVPAELIVSARALHLDGVHLEAACHAAGLARQAGVIVSFDGGAGELWAGADRLLPLVDLMVVARRFAEQHTGYADPKKAGPALFEAFQPKQVVITDGVRGCWYWDAEVEIHQPAYPVDAVDTTGAGDVFHGAYLYAYLQGWSARRCLVFAAATAALKCRELGGRAGIPSRQQVDSVLQSSGSAAPADIPVEGSGANGNP